MFRPVLNIVMLTALYNSITSITSYLDLNLSCLVHGTHLLVNGSPLLASYVELLVDLAEVFGVWVTISVLFLAAVTSIAVIQQVLTRLHDSMMPGSASSRNDQSLGTITYRLLTRNSLNKKLF